MFISTWTAEVSALRSSEAAAPRRLQIIAIIGRSNGGIATVRSSYMDGVLSMEGPFSEVLLYTQETNNYIFIMFHELSSRTHPRQNFPVAK